MQPINPSIHEKTRLGQGRAFPNTSFNRDAHRETHMHYNMLTIVLRVSSVKRRDDVTSFHWKYDEVLNAFTHRSFLCGL